MLGVCLLFVGIVLINNGMCTLYNVDGKSAAVMNILTGGLSVFINAVNLVQRQLLRGRHRAAVRLHLPVRGVCEAGKVKPHPLRLVFHLCGGERRRYSEPSRESPEVLLWA